MFMTKRKEKKERRSEQREKKRELSAEKREARKRAKSAGTAKRIREHDKELAEKTVAQRRKRFLAKDVCGFIGYDYLYKDGIAQVEEGLFSQTIAFSDISYQSSREENQRAVLAKYCQLLDYFGSGTSVQINVMNTPIPSDEIGRRVFFEPRDDQLGPYVEEYNRILNDKMREGVSNLIRERYLTLSVAAPDVDAAVQKLARMRGDAVQALGRMKCTTRVVRGQERLELLHSQLRPDKAMMGGFDDIMPGSSVRTKDIIAPGYIDFKPDGRNDCFAIDGKFGQVVAFRLLAGTLEDEAISDIISLPVPMNLSLHIQPKDKSKTIAELKTIIAWMDKEAIDDSMAEVKKGNPMPILSPELKISREDAERLLGFLQNENQRPYMFAGLVYTYADTMEELGNQVMQIVDTARARSIEIDTLAFQQRLGLNSALPLGHNHLRRSRLVTTAQAAIMMPFASQELCQRGGGYVGQHRLTGSLAMLLRKALSSPMGFACGTPGAGKSFGIKREIFNTFLLYPDDEIIIFDPAGEYSLLATTLGGVDIRFSADSETFMNPFDLSDVAGKADVSQLAFKIDAFLALSSATMAEGLQGLSEADKSIISRCVELAYGRCGAEGRTPQLEDFYAILLEQPEREASGIALRYERYVKGALSFFNNQSNVSFGGGVTNVDLHELSPNMRVFGMLTALEAVRNRMYANYERGVTTWLYLDEVQSLFDHPAVISYFSKFWAEGRKFNLICTGITQNSVYMLEHEEARNMVLNSDYIMLYKQSALDRQAWVQLLDLSPQEEEYIDETTNAGEGLLIAGGARIPIRDDFPKGMLYDLWNTKPDEIAQIKRAQRFAEAAAARKG